MNTTAAIGRGERGQFLPGRSPNPAGRPKLPEWFKSGAEDCLRVILSQATGVVIPQPDGTVLPAVQQVALESSTKERLQAAEAVANRVLGKAPEMLEVGNASAVLDVLVALAKPVNQEPEDP
jgi:hypothetical protein